MATTNLKTITVGGVHMQSGNGTPNHPSPLGSIYIDLDTGLAYNNDDGAMSWEDTGIPADGMITNVKLADMATNTLKGNISEDPAAPQDLTPTQVRALLNVENGATADQSNAEIRTAVDAAADSNVFTDAEKARLGATIPQTVSFTRNNTPSLQENLTTYQTAAKVRYVGSAILGVPTTIEVNAWLDGGTSFSVEIFDVTNGNQIAEVTGATGALENNSQSLGSLTNVPAGGALFEVRILLTGGGMGDQARISTFTIY